MTDKEFVADVAQAMVGKAFLASRNGQPHTVEGIRDGIVTYSIAGVLSLCEMRLPIGEFLKAISFEEDDGSGNVLAFPSPAHPRGLPPGPGDAA